MQERWKLIINPSAGNGKGKRLSKAVEAEFKAEGIDFESVYSEAPGHLVTLAADAYREGFRKIAMLGGDGTANEVVNGLAQAVGLDERHPKDCTEENLPKLGVTLGMIGIGTGNDWMKTLQLPQSYKKAVKLIGQGHSSAHDLGRVRLSNGSIRYFVNIAGLGFDGAVTKSVAGRGGLLAGSKLSYWLAIVQAIFTYKHTRVSLAVDGEEKQDGKTLSGAIGICKYNGGGMMQLPNAKFDDGKLDITIVGSMSKLAMIWHLPKMLNGSFTKLDAVHTYQGHNISVDARPEVWIEADGEVLGKTPASISQFSRLFRVIVPMVP